MIQTKDLRIGNLVKMPDNNDPAPVLDISWFGVFINNGSYTDIGYHELEPIPLTYEWLQRCGFERDDERGISYGRMFGGLQCTLILKVVDKCYTPLLGSTMSTVSLADIKYVHQLQNLYYALTGEELEISYS